MAIIQSGDSSNLAGVESSGALRTTIYPNSVIGAYQFSQTSGSIAAATIAASVLYTFKNAGSNLILIRRFAVGLQTTTAYTKGSLRLGMYICRPFTTQGTGNGTLATLTGNNAKKRTSFASTTATSVICTTTGITGDTATEDTAPFAQIGMDLLAVIGNQPSVGLVDVTAQATTEYPLVLAAGEGFRIKNDTAFAATGVSNLIINIEYAEVSSYQ